MTKDELKKEAFNWTEKNISVGISMYNPSIEMYCAKAYEESAEPREKRIEELEAQIEKMKCCVVSHCEGCPGLPELYEAFDKEIKENE